MPEAIKISIIEDNPQYTQSLQTMISVSEQMEFVASYESGEAYLENLNENPAEVADIVLLDLHLPGKSGLQLIPIIRKEMPETNILVLTQNNDYHTTIEAIRLGVAGYLLKDSPIASIREAITELHQGSSIIDPQLSRIVLQALSGNTEIDDENILTEREQQVLELLAMGYVKKEVAVHMGVGYRTVSQYTENIYKKLQVANVAAAVAAAIRKGMI
ncbi:MAG: response regulator transcription factor [Akkermansiaceae bacterium]|jgi:DNA-binding NarL/FixJ family response regulator|nr:response regulator transcription factor [Akkermansiaceae bacterium]